MQEDNLLVFLLDESTGLPFLKKQTSRRTQLSIVLITPFENPHGLQCHGSRANLNLRHGWISLLPGYRYFCGNFPAKQSVHLRRSIGNNR